MKYIILIILSISSLYSSAKLQQDIISQLTAIHGSQWGNLVNKDKRNIPLIKEQLKKIATGQINLKDYNIDEYFSEQLTGRAVEEYGNFVTKENGHLSEEDQIFYKDLLKGAIKKPNDSESLSVFSSLKNTGTPEGLLMLSAGLEQIDDLAANYKIARNIQSSISGIAVNKVNPDNDFAGVKTYRPNLKTPYFKRKGNWNEAISKSIQTLSESLEHIKKNSKDPKFIKEYEKIGNIVMKVAGVDQKKIERSIASENVETENPQKLMQETVEFESKNIRTQKSEAEKENLSETEEEEESQSYTHYILAFIAFAFLLILTRKLFT